MKSKLIEKINRSGVSNLTVFSYTNIVLMETFHRDSLHLKHLLSLNIDVEFSRRSGREGHTTVDRLEIILELKFVDFHFYSQDR